MDAKGEFHNVRQTSDLRHRTEKSIIPKENTVTIQELTWYSHGDEPVQKLHGPTVVATQRLLFTNLLVVIIHVSDTQNVHKMCHINRMIIVNH